MEIFYKKKLPVLLLLVFCGPSHEKDLTDFKGKIHAINYYDDKHGVLLQAEKPVYEYDGFIHVPIRRQIPSFEELIQDISPSLHDLEMEYKSKGKTCDIVDVLRDNYRQAVQRLIYLIPDLKGDMTYDQLQTQHTITMTQPPIVIPQNGQAGSNVMTGPQFNDRNDNKVDETVSMLGDPTKRKKSIAGTDCVRNPALCNYPSHIFSVDPVEVTSPKILRRQKRIAPLVVAGVAGVATAISSLFGLVTWNRKDIDTHSERINGLNQDIDLIVKHNRELSDGYGLIKMNQQIIVDTMKNDSAILHKALVDITCYVDKLDLVQQMFSTWSDTVSNSFIRVLNGVLTGKVPVDLLPGETTRRMMTDFKDFSNTIYVDIPQLLFTGGSSSLIKVIRDPPTIVTLLSFPRIINHQVGLQYHIHSCHWKVLHSNQVYYARLNVEDSAIKISTQSTWISGEKCTSSQDYVLCRKEDTSTAKKFCFIQGDKFNFTHCPLKFSRKIDLYEAYQLTSGVLVCPLTPHYTVFYTESPGTNRISVEVSNNKSHIYHSANVTSVLVYDRTYTLHSNGLIVDSYQPIHLNQTEHISGENQNAHTLDFSLHDLKDIKELTLPAREIQNHYMVLYILILVIFCFLMGVILIYRKKNQRHKKYIGHLYHLTKNTKDLRSIEMGELSSTASNTILLPSDTIQSASDQ